MVQNFIGNSSAEFYRYQWFRILQISVVQSFTGNILHHCCHNICMFIVTHVTAACFKNVCCQLADDSDIITSKHVGTIYKIVHINYRIVHILVLRKLLSSP
jgi:hypothetical protein